MIGWIMTKECPMCNELMRMRMAERVNTIPGTQQTVKREYREWMCPECDYFEDVEPEEMLEAQQRRPIPRRVLVVHAVGFAKVDDLAGAMPANTQCGPLASSETSVTSQSRER